MVSCRQDYKDAFSLCPVSARHVYLGCGRTGCGLCWAAGLFCLIQRSVSLICSGSTPANRRGSSVSVPAKQTVRRAEPFLRRKSRRFRSYKIRDHTNLVKIRVEASLCSRDTAFPSTPHCGKQRVILATIANHSRGTGMVLHLADKASANTTNAASSMLAISENIACCGCAWK